MRKLTIVFHHAGGGHRNAAEALRGTLTTQSEPWDVQLLNMQELLGPLDVARRLTGLDIESTYNLILRKGWTRFTPQLLVLLQATIRLAHSQILKALRAYWQSNPSDLVVSVIPHFNRPLAESLINGDSKRPFITLLTDLADYPPRFWIEPNSEFIIAGTERARQQALSMGHSAERIFLASGMILKPQFYQKPSLDRASERKRLGLDPDCPTAIVLFGGHGSGVMVDIATALDQCRADVQLIMICGHNWKLAEQLKHLKTRRPLRVEGFVRDIERFMAISDFFIGKPGPGSISEALQFHLPVIVECNNKTLPQERYNAEWITENRYGIVVNNFDSIANAVEELLRPSQFQHFHRYASSYSNKALWEIPGILEQCFNAAGARENEVLSCPS